MDHYTKIKLEVEVKGDHDKEKIHDHFCKLIHEGNEESALFLHKNVTNIDYKEE